ncbi:MAG: peptidoglycan recognition protein family protein [Terriglobales bacterium]
MIGLLVSWAHTITPVGIVIHHTGPLTNGDPVTLPLLEEFHKERGFGAFYYGHVYHVGYHYVIFPDGRVIPARPEHLRGAHAQHYNNFLGIVLVGDFSSKDNRRGQHGLQAPTEAQLASLVLLCRRLEKRYGISLHHVRAHRELSPTLCPGDRFPWDEFLSRLQVNPYQPHCPPLK